MKKIIHGLILLLVLIYSSCTEESLLSHLPESEEVVVRFQVNIPAYQLEHTRSSSIDENAISSLSLLLFNEEGNYIQHVEAGLSTAGSFTATLPQSSNRRIIHFVANHSWPAGFDTYAAGKSEGELIAALNSESGMRMWAREELTAGISAGTFATGTVTLIRNMAKLSVDNQATASFTLNGFYIYRAPTRGTVAPFDGAASLFTVETLTEPAGSGYSLQSSLLNPTDNWYLYERQNSQQNSSDYLFAIIKGTYSGATHFYKIDLLDGNRNRWDILRNHHYIIKVKNVMKPGYATLEAAVAGDPSNGSLEVSVSQSPIISDGVRKLQVDQTLFLFTRNGSNLDVGFRYYADMNGSTFNNNGVTVQLIEDDPANPVVDGTLTVVNPGTDNGVGHITALITDLPSGNETRTASIIVRKDDLVRTIRLVQHRAFSFEPVTINGENIAPLTGQGTTATLSFAIPADYPAELFPLEVRINTQGLTPAQQGLRLEVVNGEISYVYSVTTPGTKTLSFKTAYPSYYEVVQLDATGFATGTTGYNVQETTGSISYTDGSTTLPVPHSGSADLTTSVGYISVPVNDGQYVWASPAGTVGTTPVEVSFSKRISSALTKRYAKQVTADGLSNNSTITLLHTDNRANGSITYGSAATPVPAGAGLTFSPPGFPLQVPDDGSYAYTFPVGSNDTGSVVISYTVQSSSLRTDLYTATVTYSDLRAGNPIHLNPISSKLKGVITYGSGYSPVPEGSTITYTPAFPSGFSFTILPFSEYALSFPAGTSTFDDNLYTFSFVHEPFTYQAVVTLNYLKDGNRIHLNYHAGGNNTDVDINVFSSIHYTMNGENYPVLKDQGLFTVSAKPLSDIESYAIVADGIYKLELNTVQNQNKKFEFKYEINGVVYSLSILYGDLKANPNLVLW